ncbi:hypothetical protein CPB84DRAFT_1417657 [Gymnopilus junonius]|uniref:Uncharacterized protein n=1 Tax=Gymnopilus junonius TaxID=109634 RepID=A0A9P5TL61_GYMJU|nr:hypothetical protein CPB84DRAFT_1417657 [Gymnopilus junonius]
MINHACWICKTYECNCLRDLGHSSSSVKEVNKHLNSRHISYVRQGRRLIFSLKLKNQNLRPLYKPHFSVSLVESNTEESHIRKARRRFYHRIFNIPIGSPEENPGSCLEIVLDKNAIIEIEELTGKWFIAEIAVKQGLWKEMKGFTPVFIHDERLALFN